MCLHNGREGNAKVIDVTALSGRKLVERLFPVSCSLSMVIDGNSFGNPRDNDLPVSRYSFWKPAWPNSVLHHRKRWPTNESGVWITAARMLSQQRDCGALGTPGRLGRVDPWAPDFSKSRGREDCVTMTRDKLWPWLASVQPCSKGQTTVLVDREPGIHEKRFPHINNNHNLSDLPNSNILCLL